MTTKATYRKTFKQKLPFCLLVLCLMVMTACGNLYTGDETIFDPDRDESIKEESVPVMVAFDDPYYNILSRGVGKIDPEDEWFNGKMNPVNEDGTPNVEAKPRFFIYAFRKNNPYGYDITRELDPDICLVDGSCGMQKEYAKTYPEQMLEGHGKWAYYNGNGSFATWRFTDDKLFYSDKEQFLPYEFFAYYHDGAASGPVVRTRDEISFPVKIDGSHDLMCGVAKLTEEQLAAIETMEDEEEKQQIQEFHYSTYSGRRNIWPIFQMRHQLAYVRINLIAGNAFGDAVKVHDLKLETHTEGNFVVVNREKDVKAIFPGNAGIEQLSLRNIETGQPILKKSEIETDDTWEKRDIYLEWNEDGTQPPAITAGELLIPPGNNVILHTWLSNGDTHWEEEHTELPIGDKVETNMGDYMAKGFVAGKTYNLNITVYGPKQISIDVEATPWKDGGDVDVDMEDDIIKNK